MKKSIFLLIMLIFAHTDLYGSDGLGSLISPGPLAKDHEKYDGISTCIKCHKLGGGVPDEKCLACHDKLARRIKEKKTIHVRYKTPCYKCHRDHQGRDFRLISLDEKRFDHKETGYELEGGHGKLECAKCHKKGRYSGLSRECLGCHKDYHKKQLSGNCFRCHGFSTWKDLQKFDHDRDSKYALTGRHRQVKCERCHKEKKYRIKRHNFCDSCHKDPHKKAVRKTGKICSDCHVTENWKTVKVDHEKTRYPLTGRHKKAPCAGCHKNSKLTGIPFKTCNSSACHRDPHKSQFGLKKCETCHNTKGWKPSSFNHASPAYNGYRLEGKHVRVRCAKCHKQGRYKGLKYNSCSTSDCHRDPHKRQFRKEKCESCHRVTGWKPSLFDHNAPSYDGFKLSGKHLKTPCDKCHKMGKYRNLSSRCRHCHAKDDVHKKVRWKNCERCHDALSWRKSQFDHNKQSDFPLIGKHKELDCKKCHKDRSYKSAGKICSACHKDVHRGKFTESCDSCHTQYDWQPRNFPHGEKTSFRLRGVHNGLGCKDCHKTKGTFAGLVSKCSECHRDPHMNQFGRVACLRCHSEYSWLLTTFNHSETGYPLVGRHRLAECGACHDHGVYRGVGASCASCHEKDYLAAPNHLTSGYSQDCLLCHRADFASWDFRHQGISIGCASCHLNSSYPPKPADHTTNGWVTCEQCHHSTSAWIFTHPEAGATGCSACHLNMSNPPKPADHTTNNWVTCEQCHHSTSAWTFTHPAAGTTGCSVCHLNMSNPPKTANHTTYNWVTCEECHKSTSSWIFTHPTTTSGCSSCHLNMSNPPKPADHTTNNWVTCEQCHHSTSSWIFTHQSVTSGCSACHLNMSNPPKPSNHTTNNWVTCEDCHRSTSTWVFTHPPTTFPLNHKGTSPGNCAACHPGGNYTNSGGCVECHTAEGAKVHHTSSNAGCLGCHPTGN